MQDGAAHRLSLASLLPVGIFHGRRLSPQGTWIHFFVWDLHILLGGKIYLQRKSYNGKEESDGEIAVGPFGKRSCPLTDGWVSALAVLVGDCEWSGVSAEAGWVFLLQSGRFRFENEKPGAYGTLSLPLP